MVQPGVAGWGLSVLLVAIHFVRVGMIRCPESPGASMDGGATCIHGRYRKQRSCSLLRVFLIPAQDGNDADDRQEQ